jgi:hypothetical protein
MMQRVAGHANTVQFLAEFEDVEQNEMYIVVRSFPRRHGYPLATPSRCSVPGYTKLAQKFGQLQPCIAVFLQRHRNAWANLHLLGQPNNFLPRAQMELVDGRELFHVVNDVLAWGTTGPGR